MYSVHTVCPVWAWPGGQIVLNFTFCFAAKATAAASLRLELLVHAGVGGSKRPKQSHDIDLDSEASRAFSYLVHWKHHRLTTST